MVRAKIYSPLGDRLKLLNISALVRVFLFPLSVTFTRMDLEWLELKLGSESIDFFVSNIPRLDVQNLGELAYQLQALLKSEGKALLSMSFNDEYVEKAISLLSKRLVLKEKFVVWTGLKKYVLTKLVKG